VGGPNTALIFDSSKIRPPARERRQTSYSVKLRMFCTPEVLGLIVASRVSLQIEFKTKNQSRVPISQAAVCRDVKILGEPRELSSALGREWTWTSSAER